MMLTDAIRALTGQPLACCGTVLVVSILWHLGGRIVSEIRARPRP